MKNTKKKKYNKIKGRILDLLRYKRLKVDKCESPNQIKRPIQGPLL